MASSAMASSAMASSAMASSAMASSDAAEDPTAVAESSIVMASSALPAVMAAASPTTTVPVIHGWTMHQYGYSPGSSNVTSNVSPAMNRPLSNDIGDSGELVTVWAAVSSLDHTTVAPGSTDTPAGM